MHIVKGLMTLAVLLSFSTVTNAASGLPGETPGASGQSPSAGQSGDQQQLEKQLVLQQWQPH